MLLESLNDDLIDKLIVTITDKFIIGIIVLVCGFWLSRKLEIFKREQNKILDMDRVLNNKRIDYLEKQLSNFYWPVYLRLEKDDAIWMLSDKVGKHVEGAFILPNHKKVVEIIEANIHLAQANDELFEQIKLYMRHVAAYQTLREIGIQTDPLHYEEPWPSKFFELIEKETKRLQKQYEELIRVTQRPLGKAI
ncbi:hypothetical protein [Siphonobacter sp. SORGH_AS_0500]|uniref:hypothetical protein n=1 Tax=Siphonobacter sp. SORGH_AS_0500 TaxID=1864824 RepID=UPI002864F6FD|nr:hypothetical protein [Siphonobacter sp. SORGH_AS_0500]MDR6193672.1 hypothetical protein [Siphonobacter sp. SORGH_AS_0500]